jgi:hypothetical protein
MKGLFGESGLDEEGTGEAGFPRKLGRSVSCFSVEGCALRHAD